MRLLLDVQLLQQAAHRTRGTGRYALRLAETLARQPGVQAAFVVHADLPALPGDLAPAVPRIVYPGLPGQDAGSSAAGIHFADWIDAQGADWFVELSPFPPPGCAIPRSWGRRTPVATLVYDLIILLYMRHYNSAPGFLDWYGRCLRSVATSDVVLAISASTAQDTQELVGLPESRVVDIRGAPYDDQGPAVGRPWPGAPEAPFVLYVGGDDVRKNLDGAVAALAHLEGAAAALHLLIVCEIGKATEERLRALARRLGVEGRLHLAGFRHEEELEWAYRNAAVFVFPSFYEGLGLPLLEAQRHGLPVVAAASSSLPEFAGPGADLVDPASPASIAAGIRAAWAKQGAGRAERKAFAAAHTWDRVARDALAALTARPKPPAARPRIAWVSPMPPAATGIADYSAELLPHLRPRFDVDIVVGPGESPADGAIGVEQALARDRARPYDLWVLHLGNSHFHAHVPDLVRATRGLLVLHDPIIAGLVQQSIQAGAWPADLATTLQAEGRPDLAAGLRSGRADHDAINAVPFTRSLLRHADAVVVHNQRAARLAQGGPQPRVIGQAMPLPSGADPGAARPGNGEGSGTDGLFHVGTFGVVGRAKRATQLVAAIARLPPALRTRTRVHVVGQVERDYESDLLAAVERHGLTDQVVLHGRVALEEFTAWVRRCDAVVQLREPWHGETSAAVLRCLAAGAAVVVTDHGPETEMPADVCLRVPAGDEVEPLAAHLERIAADAVLRDRLRAAGRRWIRERHDPTVLAAEYAQAIEDAVAAARANDAAWVRLALHAAAEGPPLDAHAAEALAQARIDALGR